MNEAKEGNIAVLSQQEAKELPCEGRCWHDKEVCHDTEFRVESYVCTLPKGHSGKHMACGALMHGYAEWE